MLHLPVKDVLVKEWLLILEKDNLAWITSLKLILNLLSHIV